MNAEAGMGRFDAAAAETELAGAPIVLDRRGALYVPDSAALVVSDLHLEKGSAFARRGQLLPPYDSDATLALLEEVIAKWRPRLVVSLGDSFHDGGGAERLDHSCRDRLARMMRGRDWIWVSGNHDPDMPAGLPGAAADEVAIGGLSLRHEPRPGRAHGEIAGHLHPGAVLARRGRAVRRRCFASDGLRLILPAFGAYTGVLNILDRAYAGLFSTQSLVAHMIGRDRIYPVSRRHLR